MSSLGRTVAGLDTAHNVAMPQGVICAMGQEGIAVQPTLLLGSADMSVTDSVPRGGL
jgi:hypothetical protein